MVKFRFLDDSFWHAVWRKRGALRQTCKACHRPDKFDFNVPDDVWGRVGMSLRLLKFGGGSVDDYAICRSS
jgi:hypothetical protein